MFKIAVICGGPSPERGISLNSARSVLDHLSSEHIEVIPLYVDYKKNFYAISKAQLYSNTPSDFDYKLSSTARKLESEDLKTLFQEIDLVFPVIHGHFGEDGQLQDLLESYNVPFVGSGSQSVKKMYCKYTANTVLKTHNFPTLPSILLTQDDDCQTRIQTFFTQHNLKRAVVKPIYGGSSIGVSSVESPQQALDACRVLFLQKRGTKALLEPFCEGKEFTIVVFEGPLGDPVPLIPTEIEMDYSNNQIFDYRKKYLPTNQASYHTPARFENGVMEQIRTQAKEIFKLFGMRDFVRLDGWLMPDQTLYFTDINPISGLEQNSFLFRQAALAGLTHQHALHHVVKSACRHFHLACPSLMGEVETPRTRAPVYVLFGGKNAERQVSLMSGTNVWLKLMRSTHYLPTPYFYDMQGDIWKLPYAYTLNHTVEEIYNNCLDSEKKTTQNDSNRSLLALQSALGIEQQLSLPPQRLSLEDFLKQAREQGAFVFLGMHGGEGEDGTLQRLLEEYQISHNGSDSQVSALCMDKCLTGETITRFDHPSIHSLSKKSLNALTLLSKSKKEIFALWESLSRELGSHRLIMKPRCDGCSAGIVLFQSSHDLWLYLSFIKKGCAFIPANSFANQKEVVEIAASSTEYLLEPYIDTDTISIQQNKLHHIAKAGWIELTVGVLEKQGKYQALNPSITIAEGAVLSLEEKFQGGTGVNLTPPPVEIITEQATQKIKELVALTAEVLGIQNYARIDIFFNRYSEKIIVIEANTLPGLTPSTVLYHQGLAEKPSLAPHALLERFIVDKLASQQASQLI